MDSESAAVWILVANGVVLLANVGILGLTMKLYTEYFKDRSQNARSR